MASQCGCSPPWPQQPWGGRLSIEILQDRALCSFLPGRLGFGAQLKWPVSSKIPWHYPHFPTFLHPQLIIPELLSHLCQRGIKIHPKIEKLHSIQFPFYGRLQLLRGPKGGGHQYGEKFFIFWHFPGGLGTYSKMWRYLRSSTHFNLGVACTFFINLSVE